MNSQNYDVIIIGSGPGGNNAAYECAARGKKVLVIEKDEVGGICLNKGCMPTKALIASAEIYSKVLRANEFGINIGTPSFDWQKIMERKSSIVKKLRKGVEYLFKTNGIDVIKGEGKISGPGNVIVNGTLYSAENIIIGTGSIPKVPKGFENCITSDGALELKELPEKITIIGSGAVGIEFACIFNSFGVEVTIIEMLPRILPGMDKEISSTLEQILKRKGIEIKTNSSFPPGPWPLVPGPWSPVLLAIGRQIEKIEVNGKMETKDKGIYAVGDVTGLSMYAHSAAMQGIVAAKNICGQEAEMDYGAVPVCVFSFPEAASVGITEEQAAAKGIEVKTGKVNLAAIGKYTTLSEREGFIKVVVDKGTNKLIGCQIIGHGATDLIAEAGLAVRNGLTVEDIRKTIHAHPTLPEAVWEACAINI